MASQYTLVNHSILPLVYRILCPGSSLCYLLKDPLTKSLLMFNPWIHRNALTKAVPHSFLFDHIKNVEKESQCKLTHVISNSSSHNYQAFQQEMSQLMPEVKHVLPNANNDLKPEIIGELSVCFINAAGYTPDYHLIGVTHMTQSSTKLPVLFVDHLLGVCRVDNENSTVTDAQYISSLEKVKYFPNESFIFPGHIVKREDLMFSKAVMSSEPTTSQITQMMEQKIELFEKNHQKLVDCLIPTSVLEQKLMNPFLTPDKFTQLLGVKDRAKCFGLLRSMRKEWRV